MLAKQHGYVGQRIVSIRDSWLALKRLADDRLRICKPTELQQYHREYAVRWKTRLPSRHGLLSEWEGVFEAPGAHQPERLDIRWGR